MWAQHATGVPVLAVSHSQRSEPDTGRLKQDTFFKGMTGVKREDACDTGVLSGHLRLQSSCLHVAGEVSVALLNRFCVVS